MIFHKSRKENRPLSLVKLPQLIISLLRTALEISAKMSLAKAAS
jgi:hypothetical protein